MAVRKWFPTTFALMFAASPVGAARLNPGCTHTAGLLTPLPSVKRKLLNTMLKRVEKCNFKPLKKNIKIESGRDAPLIAHAFNERSFLDKSAKFARLRAKMSASLDDAVAGIARLVQPAGIRRAFKDAPIMACTWLS